MTIKSIIICIVVLSLYNDLYGQHGKKNIKGKIIDEMGIPIPFVTVTLLNVDSVSFKHTIADVNGGYEFLNLFDKKCAIIASAIGFKKYYKKDIFLLGKDSLINDIVLIKDDNVLNEIKITSKKQLVQIESDKTILNVANSINSIGSDVLELLRKAPNVRVINDKILIGGKNGLLIYIDGNLISSNNEDVMNILKNIQSSNIATIEIITNPSSKYDATGNAGIIFIKTKKNMNNGFNGNISTSSNFGNYKPKTDIGLNLNYRNNNINVFGNYDYYRANNKMTSTYFRRQQYDGIFNNFDQNFTELSNDNTHTFKIGTDYFLSKKSTLGVLINGNINKTNFDIDSKTLVSHIDTKVDSQLVAKSLQDTKKQLLNYDLNYKYNDSTGRSFLIDVNYVSFDKKANTFAPNTYQNSSGTLLSTTIYQNASATNISIYSLKTDYSQKLLGGLFSVGTKFSKVISDNNFSSFDSDNLTNLVTNNFTYNEKIFATYIDYVIQLKKVEIHTGLRFEKTNSLGILTTLQNNNTESVLNNYNNFFPNLLINYKFNDKNSFAIVYNKRIDRPSYQDLNPFIFVIDALSSIQGNPFLKPQLTNTIKINHIFNEWLYTSINYSNTSNYILRYRDTLSMGKTFQTNVNLMRQQNYTFSIAIQKSLTNYWNINYSFTTSYSRYNGIIRSKDLDMARTSWEFSCSNTFLLPKKISIELSGYYNSSYLDVPALINPMKSVDIGLQKKIFNDNGVIKIGMSDVFNSLNFGLKRDFGGLYYTNTYKWETRQIKLSLNYKFGNINMKKTIYKDFGSKEEEKRIN